MELSSTCKLPFGKYEGLEVGMVYLLAPSYINWMILDDVHFITDLDFLLQLKVIDRFGNQGHIADSDRVDVWEFNNLWKPRVTFKDIMHSGVEHHYISYEAIKRNREIQGESISKYDPSNDPRLENPDPLIFYPHMGLSSERTTFTPIGYRKSEKGYTIISFEANNRRWFMNMFPHKDKIRVSSFFLSDWKIEDEEMERRIEEKLPFFGRIKDGYLMLERVEVDLEKWYKEQSWEFK
ncbi:MAG: hypothetical protein Q8S14_14890 [Algoriphagus sp.]|uniref:hypothetical protein n=1 Tax=Algoriphagus sp. TaxID=1872435 RepID=UPI002730C594|nr:hypothetical protein [Algoriphagus sp.]MDP2041843.1 hypothetical protein [Algoriphagus sp.]MDP3473153.1 hypothetical protein [Algoriphagus sp.]